MRRGSAFTGFTGRLLFAFGLAATLVLAAPDGASSQDVSSAKPPQTRKAKSVRTSLGAGGAAGMISAYRRRHGLPAVSTDARLMAMARRHARAMASRGRMSHDVGGDFSTRLRRAGYSAGAAAENIAAGQRSWSEAFAGWVSSSGHRSNLLLRGATRVGYASASARAGSRYRTYWAMVIAAPLAVPRGKRGRLRAGGQPITIGHTIHDRRDAQ
jgi:uncharacterized protein YkwD